MKIFLGILLMMTPTVFSTPTTLVRTHVREAPEDIFLDLLLVLATTFLGEIPMCVLGQKPSRGAGGLRARGVASLETTL